MIKPNMKIKGKEILPQQDMDNPNSIEVKDLSFTYPGKDTPTLRGINFTIRSGEIFGFLGPSGAGKSTTQKILMGLLSGYEGHVNVLNKKLASWSRDYYERVGVSFELPNHYQKLTALENLEFFRSLYQGETENPKELLQIVGLGNDGNRRVSQFSKGMQSRLTFIRSLINKPDLIFLDEPTSGLDPTNARVVKDKVLELKKQGKTIFLTTHDMNIAEELCDRVAFIVDGNIAIIDTPRNLKVAYSKRTLLVEYRDKEQLKKESFTLNDLNMNSAFFDIVKNYPIEAMHTQEATLEDIFIQLTGESLR
ncbi:ABC transporter ATP-binding protein [Bacillus atrophaeus]|uniref:ABC transporter ATP-binding protein n=1 Tax=Bacillus atrophaeus TaxID=1452 RepID=UPI001F0B0237|nr:ABC transporter ATP-binding protein [Bacillus atrophaeus]WNV78061.1 ABC transporter ATP-binding protein [Bacillus atrophaeus]